MRVARAGGAGVRPRGKVVASCDARYARAIFEQALNAQTLRLAGVPRGSAGRLDADELMSLTDPDFAGAARALGGDAGKDFPAAEA
jgi:hypothetical protein